MLKKKLLTVKGGRESNKINFVSKTAKALLIVVLFAAVFLIAPYVLAQGLTVPNLEGSGLPTASLGVVVARIINAALGLLGLVAVIIILYGGFLWMTAKGEAERVQKAKKLLLQALVGLVIIVMAFAIAQFVFFVLGINPWAPTGTGEPGGPGGGGGGGSALGVGLIRSHYPARNAKNVPRNTKISITFKQPTCRLILDTNKNGIYGDCIGQGRMIDANNNNIFDAGDTSDCDLMNPATVKIRKKAEATGPYVAFVKAASVDNKTFVLTPANYLGNAQTPTDYTVEITNNLAYGGGCLNTFSGYNWSFQVSTELDLVPPQIESVVPKAVANPLTTARNIVIQINFNEAMDPTTLGGKLQVVGGGKTGAELIPSSFNLMTVKAGTDYVAGEFYFSNQYRTVEFITTDPCGKNSCGDDIFCLPASSEISVLVNAALTETGKTTAIFPYNGLVDMSSNSFDGNKDGKTQGPASDYSMNQPVAGTGDNATWKFNTNDLIDLIPPQVETRDPDVTDAPILTDAELNLSFDKILLSGSLVQEESLTLDQAGLTDDQKSGYWFEKNDNAVGTKTTVIIKTSGLYADRTYGIIAKSGIKDNMQNCFMPCADIGNCTRLETTIPGQYSKGSPWKGNFESCNLNTAP